MDRELDKFVSALLHACCWKNGCIAEIQLQKGHVVGRVSKLILNSHQRNQLDALTTKEIDSEQIRVICRNF